MKLKTLLFSCLLCVTSIIGFSQVRHYPYYKGVQHKTYFKGMEHATWRHNETPIISYNAKATALFARMDTTLTATQKLWVSDFFDGLDTYHITDSLDVLYLTRSNCRSNANLNWIENAHNLVNHGASWIADSGYIGNGSSAYLNTAFTPSTEGTVFKATHGGAYFKLHSGTPGTNKAVYGSGSGNNNLCLTTSTTNMRSSLGQQNTNLTITDVLGFWATWRSNDSIYLRKNTTQASNLRSAGSIASVPIALLCNNSNNSTYQYYSDFTISFWAIGGNLSLTQRTALANLVNEYNYHWEAVMPVVNAGSDATINAGDTYTLSTSSSSDCDSIVWTTRGTGTFNDNNALHAIYTPSAADTIAESVYLIITGYRLNDTDVDSMLLTISPYTPPPIAGVKIFEGAVGFGTNSKGAYETTSTPTILYVDTLAAASVTTSANSGSFEWCVTRTYPRIILFKVGGVIDYRGTNITVTSQPYCNIYGQTAPGHGISILGVYEFRAAHDMLVQFL